MLLVLIITIKLKKKIPLGKLNSKELYNILILGNYENTTSQEYFEVFLESTTIDQKDIYLLPQGTTKYSSFQYKMLNNVFYLNIYIFFKFGKVKSLLSSFFKSVEEIFIYLMNVYLHNLYGIKIRSSFHVITIPDVTPLSAIIGFADTSIDHFLL